MRGIREWLNGRWRALASLGLSVTLAAGAAPAEEREQIVNVEVGPEAIVWTPLVESDGSLLTVSGPHFELQREFGAEERPTLKLGDAEGTLEDGIYAWELRLTPKIDPRTKRRLRALRQRGEEPSVWELQREGVLPREALAASGAFSVRRGAIVSNAEKEKRAETRPAPRHDVIGELRVQGDLLVEGAKKFAVPDPAGGGTIEFAALEGPEVGTYYRGTAATVDGEATIELPATFAQVTEASGLTVQLTPLRAWSRLYVAAKTRHRLVVRDAAGGEAEFDFLVQGVRRGYGDFEPRRDADTDDEGGEP